MKATGILAVVLVIGTCQAYRRFQDMIPNGDNVAHPCKPNVIWWGVGHKNPLGGGDRNPFGKDFEDVGKWTLELCRKDSDGDGLTNGQELGDPNCTWMPGSLPTKTKGITHPGVCNPYGSDKCKDANKQVTCDTGEFICEGIHSPDVFNVTLRFPPTRVPANETTYMCYTFELDMLAPDVEYHLIATEPYIDNANVMHHTTLTTCDVTSSPMTTPAECNMAANGCRDNLAVWTLGMPGDCVYKDAGFKIRRNILPRLTMQHHWTNPELRTDYMDSSGMVLYLTRKLRKYDAAYFVVGDLHLDIPPNENRVIEKSTCSAECTRKILKEPVYLMTGWNHMHYLGYKQNVEHFRNGVKLRDLTPDEVYSYDNPVVHEYKPLVELRPGDNLETTCVYRSTSRAKTTEFGLGTYDEMCFGIFTYFPAESISRQACITWDDIEWCLSERNKMYDCDYGVLLNASHPTRKALFSKILDNCNVFGSCRKECLAAIREVRANPCFSGKLAKYTEYLFGGVRGSLETTKFVSAIHSCECANPEEQPWPFPSRGVGLASTLTGMSVVIVGFVLQINL